ncbi:MAG: winged helix-turn-helix transcriptional regulator [Xenococcus sp. (in: cyanobacteria)]
MYKDWLEAIASNRELKWLDLRVLLILLANVQGTNVEISQSKIARKLGMESSHVSSSIKKLVENGIIKKKYIADKLVGYRFLISESEQV